MLSLSGEKSVEFERNMFIAVEVVLQYVVPGDGRRHVLQRASRTFRMVCCEAVDLVAINGGTIVL